MFWIKVKCPAGPLKWKFWQLALENWKKSARKHITEKAILLNFENLSAIFRPKLFEKNTSLFLTRPRSLGIHFFFQILASWKTLSLLKLIFNASKFWQIPYFDIFWKVLFFTLALSANLVLKAVQVVVGHYLQIFFQFL